ncbi:Tat pathway signal protein [Pandoraea terrae]|uniref:Tat pathway signal protein n=1 Tax=Pandoraea terrae TaxID=1537710 RepID=A0A5E4Y287_9BURK|nr:thiosulfate oxidation carrier protein SoxY [Pandoraea terrae]VVE42438.1 Tat pathway signal protein [Pandoraea terrae]
MNAMRRKALKTTGSITLLGTLLAAGVFRPVVAFAAATWNKAAFGTTSVDDTIKQLGGTSAAESKDITLTAPDIAENGAVVPISVTSILPKITSISILIEKNPNTLAASFNIPEGTEPNVNTRVKMGETSKVHALVQADGKFYVTSKEVKVTLGGCGG